ncbi:MAG TPA: TIGR02147 family protein [Bdellovibrionota bacterium]|nr:TIGR02147 family protein [Bdellovibrionota bacterium]
MLAKHLRSEFAGRCERNPNYSLRAFARSLNLHSSTLSSILNEKRKVSPRIAKRLLDALGADPLLKQRILTAEIGLDQDEDTDSYVLIKADQYKLLADWEHFAILSALELKNAIGTSAWLATRLGIPLGKVLDCLDRLGKLGFVRRLGDRLVTTGHETETTNEVPDQAIRGAHRQYIEKAVASLENDDLSVRDITGITMGVAIDKLPEAKKMIRTFRRNMARFLSKGDQTEVYRLNVQLFPLTRRRS